MNNKHICQLLLSAVLMLCSCFSGFAQVSIQEISCEQQKNPMGIESINPRLSWKIISQERAVYQTAYQIIVASSINKLSEEDADLWNSGKVQSDQSQYVAYQGKELASRDECYWKVRVWTNKGNSTWSQPAKWEMGLLFYKDWRARWIGFDYAFPWDDDSFHSHLSARYFRKEIELNKNEIEKARVYIIGLGLYEFSLNGNKVGNAVLAPSPTDYNKNIKYNIFDVTQQLKDGKNALGVVVGNGRYHTMRQHYKGYKIKNFGFPKLLFQLEVTYKNGKRDYFRSDNSWKGTADGPIRSNNEYDGEDYDARKELKGWNEVGYDDSKWLTAEYVEQPDATYQAQQNKNMKVLKEIKPISLNQLPDGKYILDLGQNIAGWLQLRIKGSSGDKVTMRFGEVLNKDGSLFTTNLRDAKQEANYTLKGSNLEVWEPKFVYYGFRYVEISGYPGTPTLNDFMGKVVSDEMEVNGYFHSDNILLNQLYKNACWGILGNYKGMPVDCPQRNERQPWLGDRTTGCYGENFIFNNAALYKKWIDDIAYSQLNNGEICDVAPAYWRYYSDNMSWCGTWLTTADMIYQQTGDIEPIVKHYAGMKKWLSYMVRRYGDDYIITKDSYGDWCAPPLTIEAGRGKSADKKHPSALISTAYYYHYLQLMQSFARISGHDEDITHYQETASKVKQAFNDKFYHSAQATYGDDKLTDNLLALAMGLTTKETKEKTIQCIQRIINNHDNHLSSGVIGMQWLMRSLTHNGMSDLAWTIATNVTYPSWGYMVEHGATTIWELWNGNTAHPKMNSYNHVMMLGDLIVWMYEDLAGIKSSREDVGFKKIIMNPMFDAQTDTTNAYYNSIYGDIQSNWTKNKNKLKWNVIIPCNSTAELKIPRKSASVAIQEGVKDIHQTEGVKVLEESKNYILVEVGSGTYNFQVSRYF
ncbi:MAG: family 78 glycoside hydrolase catalytic domain [Mangrovibacterium sp.]